MRFRATIRREGTADQVRSIEAESRFAVYDQVQKEGGIVVALAEEGGLSSRFSWLNYRIGSGVRRAELAQTVKNLSSMLAAGLPLARALSVIERQSGARRLGQIAAQLAESIRKGSSFHEALAKHPDVFPELMVAMAKAGEEAGSLSETLATVALQMERSEELSRKVKSAMIYPAIIIGVVFLVGVLMLLFVVPTLTQTFAGLGVELPLATRIFIGVSDFLSNNAVLMLSLLAALAVLGGFFIRTPSGKSTILSLALVTPVVKEIVRETYTARASRTLSSLLASGVPILSALGIVKEIMSARTYAAVVAEAESRVKAGQALSAAFAERPDLYPVLMSDMIAVGEESGKVADMLKQVAEFYEADVALRTKDLSTVIEPVLMLAIGAFVGVFAVAMIAPIYSISSAI